MEDINITGAEFEAYSVEHKVLSDLDMAYNKDTQEFDLPAIEWDSIWAVIGKPLKQRKTAVTPLRLTKTI